MRYSTVPGGDFTMEIIGGSCRFGLWFVHVWWTGSTIHRVRFARTGIPGEVPDLIRQYCSGKAVSLLSLDTSAIHDDTVYGRIYREVQGRYRMALPQHTGRLHKDRDISPCSRSGYGTQSHSPCHSLPPYHRCTWYRRVLTIHRYQGGIARDGKKELGKVGK